MAGTSGLEVSSIKEKSETLLMYYWSPRSQGQLANSHGGGEWELENEEMGSMLEPRLILHSSSETVPFSLIPMMGFSEIRYLSLQEFRERRWGLTR